VNHFAPAAALAIALMSLVGPAAAWAQPKPGPTLAFGGDVMFDSPTRRAVSRVAAEVGEAEAFRLMFADVAPALRAVDVAFVNLETPVSPQYRQRPEGRPAVFWATPQLLRSLRTAGVDVVSIANNHAYDQGARGLLDTIEAVAAEGLVGVGAGRDPQSAAATMIVQASGVDIAFGAWSQGMNRGLPANERGLVQMAMVRDGTMSPSLAEARRRAPLVVASIHWARETGFRLGREELAIAQRAADAGADLIIGHGMHVPDRSRWLQTTDGRRVLLISALGNLSGLMRARREAVYQAQASVRDAPIVVVRTTWSAAGRLQPTSVAVVPCWISRPLPSAPWWPESGQPLARPVSILAEIGRLRRAQCGAECERRIAAYEHRAELQARLLVPGMSDDHPPGQGLSALARPGVPGWPRETDKPVPIMAAPPAGTPALRPHPFTAHAQRVVRATPTIVTDAQEEASGTTLTEHEPVQRPSASAYFRGALFPATFGHRATMPQRVDAVALSQLTQLLRGDPRLRVQITGYRGNEEAAAPHSLASARAEEFKARLTARGISAGRIQTRAGRSQGRRPGEAHLVIRLWPPRD